MQKTNKKTDARESILNISQKILFIFFLVFIFDLGFGTKVSAATYTVCSSNCDQTTIQGVFDNYDLAPGDIVEVQADTLGGSKTYNEMVTWGSNDVGSATANVTLQGRDGDTIIIDAQNIRPFCITQQNSGLSYITINNLTVTGSTTRNIWLEGTNPVSSGVVLSNLISIGGMDGIWVRNPSNSSFSNITVSGMSGKTGFSITGTSGMTPTNVEVSNIVVVGGGASSSGVISLNNIENLTISGDLTVSNTATNSTGIALRKNSGTLSVLGGVTLTTNNTGYWGIYLDHFTGTIAFDGNIDINTTMSQAGLYILYGDLSNGSYINKVDVDSADGSGIRISATSNLTIKQTISTNNGGSGVAITSGTVSSNVVLNSDHGQSIVSGNAWDGISNNEDSSILVEDFIVKNNGGGDDVPVNEGDGITGHGVSTTIARHNLIYNNDNTCFAFINDSNLTAYNNTCYSNGVANGPRGQIWTDNDVGVITLKNNIVSNGSIYEILAYDATALGSLTEDYNQFYHPDNSNFSTTDNGTTIQKNLIEWRNSSSQDVNSNQGNPLFTSAITNDFTLTYLSPAIDAGTDVGLTTDYAGNPIYGTPDIGAYEYQPPYSMGTDKIDVAANVRVYGDGKFRNVDVPSGITADFSINPVSDDISQYLDVDISIWDTSNSHEKEWTETSTTITGNTIHTVGDLEAGKYYNVTVDNAVTGLSSANCDLVDSNFVCQANSNGQIFFTWTGGYSTHTFNVTEGDNINPVITNNTIAKFHTDTASVTLSLTTSESSTCKYSTENTTYDNMTNFTTTGETSHSTEVSNLSPGKYTYYAICRDDVGNDISYTLSFEIAAEEDETDINNAKLKKNNDSRKFNDDKKIYYNQKKPYLKGEDPIISNGMVKIYKEGKKIATVDVNKNGKWSKKISFGHNKTYTLKIKFYDKYGTLKDTKKYDVNIDTKNPVFSNPFPNSKSITRNDKVIFTAVDEDSGVAFYKVKLLDKNGHVTRNWRNQDEDWYKIPKAIKNGTYILICRVYDKAGNYTQGQTTINIKDSQNSVQITRNQENDLVQTKSNQQIVNPKTCFYTVQQGDTLWSISKQIYGDATQYKRIADLNPDLNIDTLKIGQKLKFCNSNNAQQNSQDDSNSQNYNQQIQNQIQAQPEIKNQNQSETKSVHWWNPFSWF